MLHVGQNARIRGSLSSLSGNRYVLEDPATLTVTVIRPDLSTVAYVFGTDPELVRIAAGRFELVEPLDQAGTWKVRWQTSSFFRTIPFAVAPE